MPKKEISLQIPPKMDHIKHWLIMGLDPSLSCTGYAFLHVEPSSSEHSFSEWLRVGSCKPDATKNPVWLRAKLMAVYLKEQLDEVSSDLRIATPYHSDHVCEPRVSSEMGATYGSELAGDALNCKHCGRGPAEQNLEGGLGLLVVMEAPTPTDDFLNRVNAIFHEHFFEGDLFRRFKTIRILTINASTLRSLMGLFKRGNNKGENIKRAYDFIDKENYGNLDSDACDAVMLAMVARAAASILLGLANEVPPKFLNTLCSAELVARGNGRNARVTTKGLLHTTGQRPEYWYSYDRQDYVLCVRDAAQPKKILLRKSYQI
jgi:hypothetical protein